MNISRRQFAAGVVAVWATLRARISGAVGVSPPEVRALIRVLILDGINNHDWKTATRGIKEILGLQAGLFAVEVSTTPLREAGAAEWDRWRPDFSKFDVVIVNWNGGDAKDAVQWPEEVETAFAAYVRGGGGMVSYHAANNALAPWAAYNEMIGLGWRPAAFGRGMRVADDDSVIVIPQGTGNEPGHPANLNFQIHVRKTGHSITRGMPPVWMHPMEQLTHGQHGPAKGLTILTYAHSPVTGQNEPMDWVRDYGKGRVYTTMLGHTWAGEPCPNLNCVGFQTLLARGVEWAGTGRVTVAIPKDFPGDEKPSLKKIESEFVAGGSGIWKNET